MLFICLPLVSFKPILLINIFCCSLSNLVFIILSRYLINLAQSYSSFYNNNHILVEEKEIQNARLYLTYMVSVVLEKGLNLLGIQVPNKM